GRAERLDVRLKLERLDRLELQVGEPPHRLRAEQRILGRELEERAIALDRLFLAGLDRRARVDLDLDRLERLDRSRLLALVPAERPERAEREHDEERGLTAHGRSSATIGSCGPRSVRAAVARS